MKIMEIGFWISLWVILYIWGGYFLLLTLLTRLRRKRLYSQESYPNITILVTVFNEEGIIDKRLDNLLRQNYKEECFDILVASDGSTDNTNAIVEAYAKRDGRVQLFKAEGQGKSATQNFAISLARGKIVVLTDADTLFAPDALEKIAESFTDTSIGCVSGRLVLGQTQGSVAESQGLYWRFEMALRKMESQIGAMHTATGGIMAFRKDLFKQFDSKYGDDCIIPLDIIQQGYQVVHEDAAIAYDSFPSSLVGELRARTRMTLRNITCTLSKYQLLNPFKYPLVSLAIVSHKLLRWLTPFFMLAAFFTNILLISDGTFFFLTGSAQCFFYILALVGFVGERFNVRIPFASQIFSFVLANVGFFLGAMKAILGKRVTSYKNHRSCHG